MPRGRKQVRNIDTGEVFNSITEAAKKYYTCDTNIHHACKGVNKTAIGYRWEFTGVMEPTVLFNAKQVKNIDTGEVFDSLTSARNSLNIEGSAVTRRSNISQCCRGVRRSAYGYRWRYL